MIWILSRYVLVCSQQKYWQPFALELDVARQPPSSGVRVGGSFERTRSRDSEPDDHDGEKTQNDSVFTDLAAADPLGADQPLRQFVDRGVARQLDPIISSLNEQNEKFAIGRIQSPEQSRQNYFLKLPIVIELQSSYSIPAKAKPLTRVLLCYFHSFRFVAIGLLTSTVSALDPGSLSAVVCLLSLPKLFFSLRGRAAFRSKALFVMETLVEAGLVLVAVLNSVLYRGPSRPLEHLALLATVLYCLAVWWSYWAMCRERKNIDREKFDVYQYFLYLMLGYEVEVEEDSDEKDHPRAEERQAESEFETERGEEL